MARRVIYALAAAAAGWAATAATAGGGYLLIPESTNDTVGMYSPVDGSYLGDLINGAGTLNTPINAVLGPDGLIYVSDQIADAVFRYTLGGAFVDAFADSGDGLDNVRGIDFRGTELFVTDGNNDVIHRFDSGGVNQGAFISEADTFDIFFLEGGRSLVTNIGIDQMQLYGADGSLASNLFAFDFGEQIQAGAKGLYLAASFSDNVVVEFDLAGNIFRTAAVSGARGVYQLENGNWLVTNGSGVFSIDPDTGGSTTIRSGISARYIELVPAPGALAVLGLGLLGARRRRA
jgi:hypothetical protein